MHDAIEFFSSDWRAFEREHVLHPYAPVEDAPSAHPVVSASGSRLTLEDGRELIDGMSSWWAAIHGYNHPVLNRAIKEQTEKMSHVMFGGLTHRTAAELAALLLSVAPDPLEKVFFCDSGSVAVEVAIKMALQYWYALGKPKKSKLLTVRGGYHGDTLGAMAVCDPVNGMHHMFSHVLPKHYFADRPICTSDSAWQDQYIDSFRLLIEEHHDDLAAVILEPIVQGAGGMFFYCPEYLRQIRTLCKRRDVLLIFDEIATGFGRTGAMFACEHAAVSPDIMAVGKALTGGYLTLAATLASRRVTSGIARQNKGVFMHGPTFMANPLACAVGVASLRLLLESPWRERVLAIEQDLEQMLAPCRGKESVADVRVCGAIGVVELKEPPELQALQQRFIERGVWLRPFGRLVYTMPPYIIEKEELSQICNAIVDSL